MTPYVELHAHSSFSLLDGASHPEEMVAQAAALGMPALALTDHDAVYGAVRFIRAARAHNIHPVLGAEITLAGRFDDAEPEPDGPHPHLTLLVENEAGWHNLCYLISRARANGAKGEARLLPQELLGCSSGLIALSGCRQGEIAASLLAGDRERALAAARHYRELFGPDHFYIELQNHLRPGDSRLVARLTALARYLELETVVTNNVHYATQARHRLQDVLVCIRHLTTLDEATHLCRFNSEYYLKSAEAMSNLFPDQLQALATSQMIADRCQFDLDYGLQDLPHFATLHGMSSSAYLRRLCEEGLRERYGTETQRARAQLHHELAVIEQAGLANYFLIVSDIVRFARTEGIRCQGRGSAANSLVAYLLHISPIDPLAHDLVFERFLSQERLDVDARFAPDIDIDFDAQRREEVIQYVYAKYDAAHTAMACTYITFRRRSALRDIGKALALSPDVIAQARRALSEDASSEMETLTGTAALLLDLAQQIEGFPRHLGIHSGGMIITGAPLMGRVPTEPATMPQRVVVQWDKEGLEDVGLVKIDILGLRMLSAISDTVQLVAKLTGEVPDLNALTFDDPAVYEMISAGDTVGIFQVESRAQTQLQPRLQPRCFSDLVVAISLIRPGPIQGNMVHPYLRRRQGAEPVTYAHPSLKPALAETLGVILFQEQVLKVARDLAGFTAGQGEQLRRALSAKRAEAKIEQLHHAFIKGAVAQGVPEETAETVFDQLRAFGGYSFAKSHAAAFAVLVYQSAWLRCYHFLPFFTALLNNQPMGFWTPAVLVNVVKRQGKQVLPVDIAHSAARCALEATGDGYAIRLGFNYVKGLGEAPADRLIQGRPYTSLADLWQRARLGRQATENLITAGALDRWGVPRRQLLWELGTLRELAGSLDLTFPPDEVSLPPLSPVEAMLGEQTVQGLSAGDHIMTLQRAALDRRGILSSAELDACQDGQTVPVAGLVVVHQSPPTAKGHHFITLEDEEGLIDIVVRPQVYARFQRVIATSRLLFVRGTLQKADGSRSLLARHIAPLSI